MKKINYILGAVGFLAITFIVSNVDMKKVGEAMKPQSLMERAKLQQQIAKKSNHRFKRYFKTK